MMKLAAFISAALLLSVGFASAQTTAASGPAPTVLKPDQCGNVWDKSVMKGDAAAQADAAYGGGNFAQVDDVTQVDTNHDGTIDNKEFGAACAKGLVYAPPRAKE
jgi:hypothetical protein